MGSDTVAGRIGVALLNMGGPATVGQIRPFLARLFSDPRMLPVPAAVRVPLARFIAWRRAPKVAGKYQAIGGGSPVAAETARQAAALQDRLGPGFTVRPVFRYSDPGPEEVLGRLREQGVTRLLALSAYPQWSATTSGSSLSHFGEAAERLGLEWSELPAYPDGAEFVAALLAGIRPLLQGADHLLFTAHGLPSRVVRGGDPYAAQVARTVTALERRLPAGLESSLAFQSRLGPVEWIGPHVDDEIRRLAAGGVRRLVVAPVSFACENLETLWDLDREMARLAESCNIASYRRAPAPGCRPEFIGQLGRLVREGAARAGWVAADRSAEEYDVA